MSGGQQSWNHAAETDDIFLWLPPDEHVSALLSDLHGLVESDEALTREFKSDDECINFLKRVKQNEATAKAFKEFPFKGKGKPWKVEREIWFRDSAGNMEDKEYVVAHIHFSDEWDHDCASKRQQQKATSITQINLRHFTRKPTHGTGAAKAIFKSAYLEPLGKCIFRFCDGKNGSGLPLCKHEIFNTIQCMGNNVKNLIQWFPGDPRMERERTVGRSGIHKHDNMLQTVAEFLETTHRGMHQTKLAEKEEVDYMQPSAIGIEVLAIGNDAYFIDGLRQNGQLRNCAKDARAVAEAFQELGAKCRVVENVRDSAHLQDIIEEWINTKLSNPTVEKAFFFWAGHALYHQGYTHLLPTFAHDKRPIHRIRPGYQTLAVEQLIKEVKAKANCGLIICLDSCRTQVSLHSNTWTSMWTSKADESGSNNLQAKDATGFKDLLIWYSTAFGHVAQDGASLHSPFTESLLEGLRGDMSDKKWTDLWTDVCKGTMLRTAGNQVPNHVGIGLLDSCTIVPRLLEEVASHSMGASASQQVIIYDSTRGFGCDVGRTVLCQLHPIHLETGCFYYFLMCMYVYRSLPVFI